MTTISGDTKNGFGKVRWENGDEYEGQWKGGKRHGRGVVTYANGDKYEGGYVDGKQTGRGVLTCASGDKYDGDYVDGKRTGRGVYTWASGTKYDGDFVDDKRTGRGVWTWANGNKYDGDFVDGKMAGRGTFTYPADGASWQGPWRAGEPSGAGAWRFPGGLRVEGAGPTLAERKGQFAAPAKWRTAAEKAAQDAASAAADPSIFNAALGAMAIGAAGGSGGGGAAVAAAPAPAPAPAPPAAAALSLICDMGFSAAQAAAALRRCDGDAQAALNWLLESPSDGGGGGGDGAEGNGGAGGVSDEVRAQMVAFYEAYDPSKLPHVDAVMGQFAGREEELLAMLAAARAKKEEEDAAAAAAAAAAAGAVGGGGGEEAGGLATVRAQVVGFYQEYDPAKLPHVDMVMGQFAGREEELLAMLAAAKDKADAMHAAAPAEPPAADADAGADADDATEQQEQQEQQQQQQQQQQGVLSTLGGDAPGSGCDDDDTAAAAAEEEKAAREGDAAAAGSAGAGGGAVGGAAAANDKFLAEARFLRLGLPVDATRGLKHLLGIDRAAEIRFLTEGGETCIAAEFQRLGVSARDRENFRKVCDGTFPDGKTLEQLVQHPDARQALLERHHVLALRLYTTTSHPCVNGPLREEPPAKPHPFAATAFFIAEGVRKLQAVAAAGADVLGERVFWRGVADRGLSQEFFEKGGTEFACMSMSEGKDVAATFMGAECPLLLKVTTSNVMSLGADIAFLSVYEQEKEVLYPPLTYLRPKGPARRERYGGRTVLVAEVEPTLSNT
jgi:hypothetical protein